jgi:hypothetical protein
MVTKRLAAAAMPLLFLTATPTFAQQATPPASPAEAAPIVVEGESLGAGIVVNIARVANQCAACRRVANRLRPQATRTPSGEGSLRSERERGSLDEDVERRMMSESRGLDEHAMQAIRPRSPRRAAIEREAYIANLMHYVTPILQRLSREHGVSTVYEINHPGARGRNFPDVTDRVIQELDRDHRSVNLLATPARSGN